MAYTLDSLPIDGMSPISFEIMESAVRNMEYYYGNRKIFDKRKSQAIDWLNMAIEKMRDSDARIPKKKETK